MHKGQRAAAVAWLNQCICQAPLAAVAHAAVPLLRHVCSNARAADDLEIAPGRQALDGHGPATAEGSFENVKQHCQPPTALLGVGGAKAERQRRRRRRRRRRGTTPAIAAQETIALVIKRPGAAASSQNPSSAEHSPDSPKAQSTHLGSQSADQRLMELEGRGKC